MVLHLCLQCIGYKLIKSNIAPERYLYIWTGNLITPGKVSLHRLERFLYNIWTGVSITTGQVFPTPGQVSVITAAGQRYLKKINEKFTKSGPFSQVGSQASNVILMGVLIPPQTLP